MEVIHTRCAGIDISKKDAKVCDRVQDPGRTKSTSKVTTWGAVTNQILVLREPRANVRREHKSTVLARRALVSLGS